VLVKLAAFASLVCAAGPGFAQSITLSPEQQAMLDQLPPAQRQQALDALEQVQQQAGQQGASPEAEPETTPIPGQEEDPLAFLEPEIEEPSAEGGSRLVIDFRAAIRSYA
jgi:hypothetical protein